MKKDRGSLYFLLFALAFSFLLTLAISIFETPAKDIASSIKIQNFSSIWVPSSPPAKSMIKPWEVFVAPLISFRVKNTGKKAINYIAFNAVFLRKNTRMKLGTSYILAIRKPLRPGEVSSEIRMVSDGGYAGSSIESLKDNPFWEPVECKLYLAKSNKFILLGTFDIKNEIREKN